MASPGLIEGRTGTLPDGTRVIVRGGKLTTLDASGVAARAPVMEDTKTDQDAVQALREKAATSLGTAQQGEQFLDLNRKTATGPGTQLPVVPFIPKFLGESPTWGGVGNAFNPNYQAMKSISSGTAPGLRVPGSGSSSDTDVKMLKEGFPSVANLGTANELIQKRLQTKSNQDSARAAFNETWFQKRGSLLGADTAFGKWWSEKGAATYDMTRPGATGIAARQGKRPPPPPTTNVPKVYNFDANGNPINGR